MLGILCLVLAVAPLAHATRMLPLSIEQLTAKADLVLEGRVGSKTVQRDAQGRIYTRIELNVRDAWKGQLKGQSFTLVQSGGVLGEETASVDGQEDFNTGEDVVVFLVLNQRGEGLVIGLSQGKFKVRTEAGGEKVVHNLFHGTPPGPEPPANAKSKTQRLSLRDLKQRVQGGRP